MLPEDRKRASREFGEIYESLMVSMHGVGGIMRSIDGLINMTALDLLCELAPNRIRFTYTPGTGDCKADYRV